MNAHFVLYFLGSIAVIAAVPLYLRIVNAPAFLQTSNEVVVREPGRRFLGKPHPVMVEAEKDIDFALLSQIVYQHKLDPKEINADECVDADRILESSGWIPWTHFSDANSQALFNEYHLRVEVWSNVSKGAVAVTFAGTDIRSLRDLQANLRWFLPHHTDEYTVVVTNFGSLFVKEWKERKAKPDWRFLNDARLYSTGHSLGGGLAQEFAYSLPISDEVPRVDHVYAFDPSPVTGFYSIDPKLRDNNRKGLAIDRIYERGEVLSIVRSLIYFFRPPSPRNPAIRQVRYNLFSAWTAIAKHSIARLACKLHDVTEKNEPIPASAA